MSFNKDCNSLNSDVNLLKKTCLMSGIKVFFLFIFYCSLTFGQESRSDNRYVKIIVKDVLTSSDGSVIDTYIRLQTGVIMSRMDYRTSLYFCIYNVSSGISVHLIKMMIFNLGFSPLCSVSGNYGNGEPMEELNKGMCGDSETNEVKVK